MVRFSKNFTYKIYLTPTITSIRSKRGPVLVDKTTKSKHKGVSKKGMGEMATDSYMPTLEESLLDDLINRSLLSEQEAKDLTMRTEADPMTLVLYRDCLFGKEVFHAKNVGIRSKDHTLCPLDTKRWILSNGIS